MTAAARPDHARRNGPQPRFSREQVLEAALDLIDREGLEALKMRRLADEMGVGAMTLYGYVRTKDEILDGVGGLLLSRLTGEIDPDAPWDRQLESSLTELHAVLQRHPGAVQMLTTNAIPGPELDRVRETLVGILRDAGLSKVATADALGALVAYVLGFTVAERARGGDIAAAEGSKRLRRLPVAEYPHLSELADEYPAHMSNRSFVYGLNHLLEGLRNDIQAAQAKRRARKQKAGRGTA